MAVTETTYTGNGSTTNYSFTFPYLKTTDIKASIDGTATDDLNDFAIRLFNATTVQFVNNTTDNTPTAPANNAAIRIYRETDDSKLEAEFFAGSAIKSSDLNDNFNQNLYVTQESNNKINTAWTTGDKTIVSTETWVSNDTRVSTTAAQDGRIDSKIDTALTTDVVGGQSITITDNSPGTGQITASVTAGSIRGTELAGDAVDGSKIADDSIDSEHIASGAVDLEHMSANSVDSNQYVDGSIDLAHMSANSVDSDQYVDGSIDKVHLASDVIDGTKLEDNAVNSEHITSGAVDLAHMSANSVDSDQYVDGSIDRVHLSADIIDGTKIADTVINSEHYAHGSIDHVHLSNDCIDGDNIQDDVVNSEHIAAGALDTEHYATGSITADKLNSATVITNSEQSGASANDTSFFTSSASDARYFNISSGDTIKDGDAFPDNDTTIATTAAINDRIIDLVDDVGGFVPIANETSFPNANPDVNNGAGTLVSIKALSSNLTSNGSGVATIANGTVGNSTVTITGLANSTTYASTFGMIVETTSTLNTYTFHRLVPKATEVTTVSSNITNINACANNETNINAAVSNASNINSAVSNASNINSVAGNISNVNTVAGNNSNITTVAGANSNISTVATNINNVNLTGGSIANVNTVATNLSGVNSFAERYRVASSAPTSSLDEGDLYFDTTGNELKVYNGTSWQGGVTATGNLVSKSGDQMTGNLTFSGSQTVDGRDVSVDGTKLDTIETNATADQTAAEIRTLVESATDSNVFTDADHTKLNAIEASATADQTAAEIVALVADQTIAPSEIDMEDNEKIKLGNSDDLELYHDGTDSKIFNHTGTFKINSNDFLFKDKNEHDTFAKFIHDGAVELYYDGSKKFETTSLGVKFSGYLQGDDGNHIRLGTSDDFNFYHSGNENIVDCANGHQLHLKYGSEHLAKFIPDGAVELYHDNSKKLETGSGGISVTGGINLTTNLSLLDDGIAKFGTGDDLQIYHDGSDSYIKDAGTGQLHIHTNEFRLQNAAGNEQQISADENGQVKLFYDGNKKFETTSDGATVSGHLKSYHLKPLANDTYDVGTSSLRWRSGFFNDEVDLPDNGKLKLGDSDDLQIYHDGNDSFIKDTGTGGLYICASQFLVRNAAANEIAIQAVENGAVELYYDNSKKCETGSYGLAIDTDSDIRFANGSWTGNAYGKIQQHSNYLYIGGGSNGLIFRHNDANRWVITSGGHLEPATDSAYDIGANAVRIRNVYADTLYGDGSNLTNLPSSGGTTPTVKTSNYTASNGDMVVINGTGLTITLPSGPSTGDSVKIRILGDRYCTVARNSQNINGSAEDAYIDIFDGCATFTYVDSTRGWLIGC